MFIRIFAMGLSSDTERVSADTSRTERDPTC